MEVAQTECARMADHVISMIDESRPIRELLMVAAMQLTRFLVSDFVQQIFRICVAECDRFPELGQAFYKAGPENGKRHLMEYLKRAADRGELSIDDIAIAAEQFTELCKVRIWMRAVIGIQTSFTDEEIHEIATQAVEMFMARYQGNQP